MQDQTLMRLLAVTVVLHLIFAVWPTLDIAVSRVFWQGDGNFWLTHSVFAEEIRMPIWLSSVGLAVIAAVMLCASLLRGAGARTDWRLWAFVTTLYVVGPGLLVNVILKQNWGRARPVSIEAFGGTKLFTPPFEIAGQCVNNCSFVSGEAASAAVMVVVLAVCFGREIAKPWRGATYTALAGLFVLAAAMRVASGRHFLSDVVFAGLFMMIIARLLYRAYRVSAPQNGGLMSAMLADLFGRRAVGLASPTLPEMEGVAADNQLRVTSFPSG